MSDRSDVYALAYAEGIRTLGIQAATLDQVRIRSASVLTTATVATAFLVGAVVGAGRGSFDAVDSVLALAGSVLYAAILVLVVGIQLPRFRWRFHLAPAVIVHAEAEIDRRATIGDVHRALALYLDQDISHNQANLDRMHRLLAVSLVLLVFEVAVWAILLATNA